MNSVRLSICGDICSDRGYRSLFEKGLPEEIFGDSLSLLRNSDIAITNLECPLTSKLNPIHKTGPCLLGPPVTAMKLAEAGISAVCLGNNHILDQGEDGLKETIRVCREAGIDTFGAGLNVEQSRQPFIAERNGIVVGVYSMAESEFSIAGEESPGANPIDLFNCCKDLRSLRSEVDIIVVLLHAGKENYPLPSPKLQQLCRGIVDAGANLIVCQHSHCIGALEKYDSSVIVYGQGNFLFEQAGPKTAEWNTGFIIDIVFFKEGIRDIEYHYYEQCTETPLIRMLTDERLAAVKQMHENLNRVVNEPGSVAREWRQIALREGPIMLLRVSGFDGFLLKLLYRLGVYKLLHRQKLAALNLIRCETHRELLEEYLSQ